MKRPKAKPRNLMEAVLMADPGPPLETFKVWVFRWEDGAVTATTDTPTAKTRRYLKQGTLTLDPPSPRHPAQAHVKRHLSPTTRKRHD